MPKQADRERPMISLTISYEALGGSDEIAKQEGMTRSGLIEYLVRREAKARGLDLKALGKRAGQRIGLNARPEEPQRLRPPPRSSRTRSGSS